MSSRVQEPTDRAAPIAKVAAGLADDYRRRGGYLSGDHVLRAVEKRGLDPEDDVLIRQTLRDLGVEIDDFEQAWHDLLWRVTRDGSVRVLGRWDSVRP